jgi:hypothetical protein
VPSGPGSSASGSGSSASGIEGSAGSGGRPDLRINRPGGALVGNNVYGSAKHQTVAQTGQRGRKLTYWISVQNDAKVSDLFRLTGPRSSQGVTVKYLTPKGVNVTKRVVAGTFRTPRLAAGASYRLKVVVKVTRHARVGTSLAGTVKAFSNRNHSRTDAVAFAMDVA